MNRIVNRTYYSKRTNTWVHKTYEYALGKDKRWALVKSSSWESESKEHRTKPKSQLLVGKNGRVYKDRIEKFFSKLDDADSYEAGVRIAYAREHNIQLSEKTLTSMLKNTKIETFLSNLGRTAEELAEELGNGAKVADIYNEDNWKDGYFYFKGRKYEVNFDYYAAQIFQVVE